LKKTNLEIKEFEKEKQEIETLSLAFETITQYKKEVQLQIEKNIKKKTLEKKQEFLKKEIQYLEYYGIKKDIDTLRIDIEKDNKNLSLLNNSLKTEFISYLKVLSKGKSFFNIDTIGDDDIKGMVLSFQESSFGSVLKKINKIEEDLLTKKKELLDLEVKIKSLLKPEDFITERNIEQTKDLLNNLIHLML